MLKCAVPNHENKILFFPRILTKVHNPLGVKNWPKIEIEPIYRYLKWEVLWSMMNCFFRLLDFSSCLLMLLLASRLIECSWHVLLEKKSKISDQCHLLSVEKYYNLLCSKKVLDKLAPQISPKFSLNSYSYIFWHHFPKYFKNFQKFSKISTFSTKDKLKIDSFRMHWEKEVVQTSRLTKTKPLNN